ncbi:MAG: hypothetical protein KDB05_26100 [Planctomycetales bacterium]|nr:hypothetical protein [Planctomycetales bacterium]
MESQNGGVGGYSLTGDLQGLPLDKNEPDDVVPPKLDLPDSAVSLMTDQLGNATPFGDFRGFTIHRRGDVDWYSFKLDTVGRLANSIGIEFVQDTAGVVGAGRLTLDILRANRDPNGNMILDPNQMQVVSTGVPSEDKNSIVASVYGLPVGDYFVRVQGNNGETNRYSLRWDLVTTSRFPFVITNDGFRTTKRTNNSVADSNPLVDSGLVAWTRLGTNGDFQVVVWDSTKPDARDVENLRETPFDTSFFNFDIDGSIVVWSGFDGSDYEIYQFDMKTGVTTQLTDNAVNDILPRMSGQRVVWVREPNSSLSEIILFDSSIADPSQRERRLTNNDFQDRNPQIDGTVVAWEGKVGEQQGQRDYEIFLQDVSKSNGAILLTSNDTEDQLAESCVDRSSGCRPVRSVDSGRVVWVESQDNARSFWVADTTGQATAFFGTEFGTFSPLIFGSSIVWQGLGRSPAFDGEQWLLQEHESGGPYNIFLFDGKVVRQLTTPELGFGFQKPYIDNQGRVLFEGVPAEADPDDQDFELFVYENGTTRRLTNDSFNQVATHINDGYVVWSQSDGQISEEIYLQTIAPATLTFDGQFDPAFQRTVLNLSEQTGGVTSRQTIRRVNVDSYNDLVVTLRADKLDPNGSDRISVPPTVVIPRGQMEAVFDVTISDDSILQETEVVRVFATADGFDFGELQITLTDRESLSASLDSTAIVKENAGAGAVKVRVERNVSNLGQPLVITLTSNNPNAVKVPPQPIVIPVNQTSIVVDLDVVGAVALEADKLVTFTATAASFEPAAVSVTVRDHSVLTVTATRDTITGSGEGEGNDSLVVTEGEQIFLSVKRTAEQSAQNLTLTLASDGDKGRFTVPPTFEFLAGVTEVMIPVPTVNNSVADGDHVATFTVFADGFEPAVVPVTIQDNDVAGAASSMLDQPIAFQTLLRGTTLQITLTSQPLAAVLLDIAEANPGLRVLPAEITFTPANWNLPQSIMIAVGDSAVVPPKSITLKAASDDPMFQGDLNPIALTFQPEVERNLGASVASGQTVVITHDMLRVSDADTAPKDILYTMILAPSRGTVRLDGQPLPANGTFTQADIDAGKLSYRHGGGVLADRFDFSATDLTTFLVPQSFRINNLDVRSFQADRSGFSVELSRPVDPSTLNLFDALATLGPADITIVGTTVGPVQGSLVVDSATEKLTFIKTGSLLIPPPGGDTGWLRPDTYTVTLRSGANGVKALNGELLDGNSDGTPDDQHQFTFTVPPQPAAPIIVSIPDVVRGPGQEVRLPANDPSAGIPLLISTGVNVGTVGLQLRFDPKLLDVSGFRLNPALADRATVETNVIAGSVFLKIVSSTGLSDTAGTLTLGWFDAIVPATVEYREKHLLDVRDAQVLSSSGEAVPVVDDDGIHVVGYIGDVNGNGRYQGNDTGLLRQRVASLNAQAGFLQMGSIDPVLVGDVSGNGRLQGNDTGLLRVQVATGNLPIPDAFAPVDPRVFIPRDLTAAAGTTITVPVKLLVTEEGGITLGAVDLLVGYDPTKLTPKNTRLGAMLPANVFAEPATDVDAVAGVLFLTTEGSAGLALSHLTVGDLVLIDFEVNANASGTLDLNLIKSRGSKSTELFDHPGFVEMILDPSLPLTNLPTDAVDGIITIPATNSPPTLTLTNTVTTLPESQSTANRIRVADITINDDGQGTNNLSLAGADQALFEIDANQLFIRASTVLDATANPVLDVTVRVDDPAIGAPGTIEGSKALAITITARPTLSIAAANADKNEGNTGQTAFTFTVTRGGNTSGATSVDFAVTGNTANAADFVGNVLPSGQVQFNVNETTKTITVNVASDTTPEPDERFVVTLSNPSGGATITAATANGIIRNDDAAVPALSITAVNADKNEGNAGPSFFTFTVTRTGDTSVATTVDYAVTGSFMNATGAAEPEDFDGGLFPTGQLVFAPGSATQTITIRVNGDAVPEGDDGFEVLLTSATGGALIKQATAHGVIRNDDTAPPVNEWRNSKQPLDVNNDGHVTPLDALIIINYLNNGRSSALPSQRGQGDFFLDTSDDRFVTPGDVVLIINHLGNLVLASAEATDQLVSGFPIQIAPQISEPTLSDVTTIALLGIVDPVLPNAAYVSTPEALRSHRQMFVEDDLGTEPSLEEAITAIANDIFHRTS